MAALSCEICGGKLIGKPGGVFECDSCGMEYSTEWAKAKIQEIKGTVKVEGTVEVTGKVQIDGGTVKVEGGINIESLLKRGQLALEDSQWEDATRFFDDALNLDAECAEAYLGKAMAEMEIREKRDLGEVLFVFNNNRNYEKALRFADIELKNELDKYSVARTERQEQGRIKAVATLQTYSEYFKRRDDLPELLGDLSPGFDACDITIDQFADGSFFLLQRGMWEQVPQVAMELGLVHRMDFPEKKPALTQEEISQVQALVPGVRISCFGSSVLLVTDATDDSRYCAKSMVNTIVNGVEVNKSYCGRVSRLLSFGAFVELAPNQEGMVHISKLADRRVEKVEDVVSLGDIVWVKVTEIDKQGRINLSMKDAICMISPRDKQRKEAKRRAEEKRREEELRAEAERQAEQARIEAERKAEQDRIEAKRQTEQDRIVAERIAKRKAEQEKEKAALETELANLKGLFSGKRRKEIETRLAEIENQLKYLYR